ncbi:hypothetical protein ACFQX6_38835 [Streptosporangium lutulentum]
MPAQRHQPARRSPLFAGRDDRTSVFGDPADGWGRLMAHGADIIQTDWPGLLCQYRQRVRGIPPRTHVFRDGPVIGMPPVG